MNVYEDAHALAGSIKASNEFIEFDALRKKIRADEQLNDMMKNFHSLQMKIQAAQLRGEKADNDIERQLQGLYAMMTAKPEAMQFLQAEMRFSVMMKDVYEILADAADIKIGDFM